MVDAAALRLALDLLHVPSRARLIRTNSLPPGVPLLLRIAADDEEAVRQAVKTTERPVDVVRAAAGFFIEQILWYPGADSYRVLGASPQSPTSEIKRNMALLMVWLHPDQDHRDQRSVFLHRVTAAWNDLKTPERRATYDQQSGQLEAKKSRRRRSRSPSNAKPGAPVLQHVPYGEIVEPPGILRRVLNLFLGRART